MNQRSIEESNTERAMLRDAVAAAAHRNGRAWLSCPDDRCYWGISCSHYDMAEAAVLEHLRTDPRHTNEEWTDRDGRDRRGFDYLEE